jgi:uncharacterized membrane protein YhaH (DUF805 family)
MHQQPAVSPVLADLDRMGPAELAVLALIAFTIWAAWHLCEKVDWPGRLSLLLLVPLANFVFLLALLGRALPRAGFTAWLALFALIPVVGFVMLYALALSRWPGGAAEAR